MEYHQKKLLGGQLNEVRATPHAPLGGKCLSPTRVLHLSSRAGR